MTAREWVNERLREDPSLEEHCIKAYCAWVSNENRMTMPQYLNYYLSENEYGDHEAICAMHCSDCKFCRYVGDDCIINANQYVRELLTNGNGRKNIESQL